LFKISSITFLRPRGPAQGVPASTNELNDGRLVYRLPGALSYEGAFVPASFWPIDPVDLALVHAAGQLRQCLSTLPGVAA
jgi:hypothetical protein